MKYFYCFLFVIVVSTIFGQSPTQSVRGTVKDSDSQSPIVDARIQIFTEDTTKLYRTKSDLEGNFSFTKIPVGKHEMVVRYMGYKAFTTTIIVNSGKETIVHIPLEESVQEIEEVVVKGRKKGEVINELALLSAQQFSVEETERYPGSRSDPARMASNFAGVGGADDSRNDIIIRGNSPLGVVWRIEGVDIPNPSHFAISGSTGGPVTILNNKMLANSDFFMSAFPAEYGNSISGVFDLKLRKGNNKNHEFTGQFGFLGTEVMAEGPLRKDGKASYLVMGRYSTLSIFKALGLKLGTDAVPVYGDGAFKFDWKLKKGGAMSLFAMGGASNIEIVISQQDPDSEEIYGEGDRDQYFGTQMIVGGLTYKKSLSSKTFLSATVAHSYEKQGANHDFLARSPNATNDGIIIDSIYPLMGYYYKTQKSSAYVSVNHKLSKKHLIKVGGNLDLYHFNMLDSVLNTTHSKFINRWDYKGVDVLARVFLQWRWKITDKMTFTAGLHNQYFSLSDSYSIAEPRIGWKWKLKKGQAIFAGAGMHSQTQPNYTYLYHLVDTATGKNILHNKKMDFSRSLHAGIGYEKSFQKGFSIKTEAYYQYLYNVPVTQVPSSFSLINMGSGFARFFPEKLINKGTGYNYGLELTVQKFFSKSFFFLFSGTVYDSKYTGSDGIERNTSYNGNYIFNLLGGKEFKIGKKHSISVGLKVTYAGGKRYGFVDLPKTQLLNEIVYLDSLFNERQFRDYFRIDVKVGWKMNTQRATHEIGLDLVNITAQRNLLSLSYAPNILDASQEPIAERHQLGFLPIFYYRVDFKWRKRSE